MQDSPALQRALRWPRALLPACILLPYPAWAETTAHGDTLDLTASTAGYLSLAVFLVAYLLVSAEEFAQLRKSKSVIVAAGVALMDQARGKYTFFGHLRWLSVIALGYAASVQTHMWINAHYF